jgi:DHA1 family bicyclomycin/chloramphenicol resistance-like MFS transporter
MRISPNSVAFTALCGALMALPSMSIDVGLPAFDLMAEALKTDPSTVALTLTTFLLGFSVAPLLYGPLSDRVGRRPVLIIGCGVYAITSIFCMLTGSIAHLLAWRLLQGMSAGAGPVLALSLIRDCHEGLKARTLLSTAAVFRTLGPMLAPSIGAFLMTIGDWRWIYGFMAVGSSALFVAVTLFLPETAPKQKTDGPRIGMIRSFGEILRNRRAFGNSMVLALNFGSHFSYVAGSSLVVVSVFNVSPQVYALMFGICGAGIMAASAVSAALNKRGVDPFKLVVTAATASVVSMLIGVILSVTQLLTVEVLGVLLVVNAFSFGLLQPNVQQAALQSVAHVAGAASALMNAMIMGMGAIGSVIVKSLVDFGALSMTGTMLFFCLLTLACVFWANKKIPEAVAPEQMQGLGNPSP